MYQLFYDDMTGSFFIGNEVDVTLKLRKLAEKVSSPIGSFSFNEYCRALGIFEEDPFGGYIFTMDDFDYPFFFDICKAMCNGIPAMKVRINSV